MLVKKDGTEDKLLTQTTNLIIDSICKSGGNFNLDCANYHNNIFWVIDGATALTVSNYEQATKKVIALVKLLDETFRLESEMGELFDIKDTLNKVVAKINNCTNEIKDRWELPSACIGVVKVGKEKLEYYILGDITLAINTGKDTLVFCDDRVKKLDAIAINQKTLFQKILGMNSIDARKAIIPLLRKNREKMNTPKGYWIFNGDKEAINNAISGEISLTIVKEFILATDGFSRLVDTVAIYTNWGEVFESINKYSLVLSELLLKLRNTESLDRECLVYPRFSVYDDASAIYVKL